MGSKHEPRYAKHVRDIYSDLDDLFAAGEQVRSMLTHPGWRHVALILHAEIAEIDGKLDGRDTPLSQAEYALEHGRRHGLRSAEQAAGALVSLYERALRTQQARHEGAVDAVPERV